jgi:hypothetical protein
MRPLDSLIIKGEAAMKWIDIWKRLGKQSLKVTQHNEAIVFVDGKEYIISGIRYDSGKIVGFETIKGEE